MSRAGLMVAATLSLLAACGRPRSATPQAAPAGDVVATVNGVPIREQELDFEVGRAGGHDSGAPLSADERRRNLLETVVRKELAAQRAAELGLDSDQAFQAERRRMEAQLHAWRRQRLAELLYRTTSRKRPAVSDSEARRHFDENRKAIRTEVRVEQLLLKDEQAIARARAELEGGASFEQVFTKHAGPVPAGGDKPWDPGWLAWDVLPEPWRPAIAALKPGQLSDVIRGPNHRFWVLRLVASRENEALTFEDVKGRLVEHLQTERRLAAREALDAELRAGAEVVLSGRRPEPVAPARAEVEHSP